MPSTEKELLIDDQDRYSRMRLIGWWDQSRIAAAQLLVVGAGALGNEVLKNLALLGLGRVVLIDMDTVDKTNLTRSVLFRAEDEGKPKADVAAKMMREINPDCQVEPIVGNVLTDIGLGLVRQMDIVIGCLDNREARLWVNRMCWKVGTPWIDGGIQEINGVAKVFRPPNGACYECAMTDLDYQLISLRYSCPLLKQEDILQGKVPTAPTIASIIGGLQVQEALKLIHEIPGSDGSALVFNGVANKFYETKYPVKADCLSHEYYEQPLECELTRDATLAELFQWLERKTGEPSVRLSLDRDLLTTMECRSCDRTVIVGRPRCLVPAEQGVCAECKMPMQTHTVHTINSDSPLAQEALSKLGIPKLDILKIDTETNTHFVWMAGDRPVTSTE